MNGIYKKTAFKFPLQSVKFGSSGQTPAAKVLLLCCLSSLSLMAWNGETNARVDAFQHFPQRFVTLWCL